MLVNCADKLGKHMSTPTPATVEQEPCYAVPAVPAATSSCHKILTPMARRTTQETAAKWQHHLAKSTESSRLDIGSYMIRSGFRSRKGICQIGAFPNPYPQDSSIKERRKHCHPGSFVCWILWCLQLSLWHSKDIVIHCDIVFWIAEFN